MNKIKEMVEAIRDWVNNRVKKISEDIGKEMKTFKQEVDLETILRKTGDASKVTNKFSEHKSRELPESGERLEVTIGKITKWLNDLSSVAVSGSYKEIWDRPVQAAFKANVKAIDAAEAITLLDLEGSEQYENCGMGNAALIYGSGGLVTAVKEGTTDFVRVYLVYKKKADSATGVGEGWTLVQLGSAGSTARWSLAVKLTTTSSNRQNIILNIPKGSWADVNILNLPSSNYLFE